MVILILQKKLVEEAKKRLVLMQSNFRLLKLIN